MPYAEQGPLSEADLLNSELQASNYKQIPIPNDQNMFGTLNFGHGDLFVICDLEFLKGGQLSLPLVATALALP